VSRAPNKRAQRARYGQACVCPDKHAAAAKTPRQSPRRRGGVAPRVPLCKGFRPRRRQIPALAPRGFSNMTKMYQSAQKPAKTAEIFKKFNIILPKP